MFAKLARKAVRFLKQEDGPTAVEYAVMLALIIVVCIALWEEWSEGVWSHGRNVIQVYYLSRIRISSR